MRSALGFSDAFALVLQRHRIANKLSRQELANRAGLHQTYIGIIERGLSNPTLEVGCAIAQALEVPLSRLVSEAEALWQQPGSHRNQRKASREAG